jgi:hypothetical protein
MSGLLIGIVQQGDQQLIGFSIPNGPTLVFTPEAADVILNQIGMILDSLGYFDDDEGEKCSTTTKH